MRRVGEGDDWVVVRWQAPTDGGKATFYKIHRQVGDGEWEDAGTSTDTEQLMSNQPRGVELLFGGGG